MAKKSSDCKGAGKQKFAVRGYTRCSAAAVRAPCTASSACAASASARWRTPVSSGHHQVELVVVDLTYPVRAARLGGPAWDRVPYVQQTGCSS
jgi:hypothetical protein